jgi:histidinol-phosphate aminotransferase
MITRRLWLRQLALASAGIGIAPTLEAAPSVRFPGAPGPILLNSNENAFGPSPRAVQAMAEAASRSNRYPDDYLPDFRKKLATHWGVAPENFALGGGATEIIALTCQLLGAKGKGSIVTSSPSYQVWHRQAGVCGLAIQQVPLNEMRQFDLDAMTRQINADTRMVYVCNPNNPTGLSLPFEPLRAQVLEISRRTLVMVDEAYTELAGIPSMAVDAAKNPNLLVVKTFSKVYGLAGARLGYAIGHPDTIAKISALQGWRDVSVSTVTCAAASASLDDTAFVQDCIRRTAANRETCYKTFSELGLAYLPSQTSFILFDISKLKGDFSQRMAAENIMVQYRDHFGGKWCRVSMGSEAEMAQFCAALKRIAAG